MPFIYFLVFCLISIAVLYAEASGNTMLIYVCKPLIMLWLILYFVRSVKRKGVKFFLFLFGFITALTGDIMLMFSDSSETFFLLGLGFFLITHVFYILAFLRETKVHTSSLRRGGVFFVVAYGFMLLFNLWDGLGEMVIPVTIYALAITVMVITSIIRSDHKTPYVLLMIGALFFMISDSLIAVDRFSHEILYSRLLIMLTYIVAQFYIVNGAVYSIVKNVKE